MEIHANYFENPEDIDEFLESLNHVKSMIGTKTFKNLGMKLNRLEIDECSKYPTESKGYWECNLRNTAGTLYHPVGTTKMGPIGDNETVVDSELKVLGIEGLRVIDASIMPEITSGNTNSPTMMIGEKGADLIKNYWLPVKDEL